MTVSRTRSFMQVDVFSTLPCGGNPVAVVLDGTNLTDEETHRLARWTNLSRCRTCRLHGRDQRLCDGRTDPRTHRPRSQRQRRPAPRLGRHRARTVTAIRPAGRVLGTRRRTATSAHSTHL
ncbi:PhzF family phenazine biosynthesis protein [Streptomyces sp. NPDC050509]|uniref:PhzF family phenazine biosynthesis protein n=1 Tax=Streptomyces sp. NPDC050509 TaxID=3365620 RepID=UPI0037995A27